MPARPGPRPTRSTPRWPASRTPWPRNRGSGEMLALLDGVGAEQAAPGSATWSTLASPATLAATPAGPELRAADPHRRRLHPRRDPDARRPVHPARESPASSPPRTGPGRQPGRRYPPPWPGRTSGHPADPDRAGYNSAAHGGHRARCQPARRLVHRRPSLDPGTAAPAPRRRPDLGVVRARRHSRGHRHREPRPDHRRRGIAWLPLPPLPPGTATLAPGPGGAAEALAVHGGTLTIWQHVAAVPPGPRPGRQRPHPVRILKLRSLLRVRLAECGLLPTSTCARVVSTAPVHRTSDIRTEDFWLCRSVLTPVVGEFWIQ